MANRFTGEPHSDALVLDRVVQRIAREHRVGEEVARSWMVDALWFLRHAAAADQKISPGPDADRAWHEFILFTRDYEQYCEECFGRFIHHEPWGEPARRLRWWERMRGDRRKNGGCGAGGGGADGDGGGGCGGGCGGG